MKKEENVEVFAGKLSEIRQRRGYTKKKMASELGVTPAYYADLEAGVREPGQSLGILVDLLKLKDEAEAGRLFGERSEPARLKDDEVNYGKGSPWLRTVTFQCGFVESFGNSTEKELISRSVDAIYSGVEKRVKDADQGGVYGGNTIREPER